MHARAVKHTEQARKLVESSKHTHVKVGVFDIDGVMRGKYMSREKFLSALDTGFGFCDVVLGWDVKDRLYDNAQYTGWHTGYPDAPVRILPSTCRYLPLEDNMLFFLGEFSEQAESICPRAVLRRVIEKAQSMGFNCFSGFEYEFFVFDETAQSIREKKYQNLTPLAPSEFGYSVIRNSVESDLYESILTLSEEMDFLIEGLHEETGPGVLEAALTYTDALDSADKAGMFKTFTKILLQKQDKIATFMARWSADQPGQSGHIHLSLQNDKSQPLFFDATREHNMSDVMRYFAAGQQQLMPEFMAMIAPTVNSYRRLIPGLWAPTHASVGVDNRTCAIRIIPGSEKSQRLEFRVAAADANPYLVLAAVIASGLWGIENKAEIESMVTGNAYEQSLPENLALPQTLWDAAQMFKSSTSARDYFGDAFVEHFAATREWEEREYRKHISQWELERYFEII
ncbi:MAG TPA: glutamine synthetase [Gammaproteobacteria bacterium]|nr:glutamine synthetase [Gammaproteobacteria bacterium]